jgi:hypothetical protein
LDDLGFGLSQPLVDAGDDVGGCHGGGW